jgi:hypothetical protein
MFVMDRHGENWNPDEPDVILVPVTVTFGGSPARGDRPNTERAAR